MEKLPLLSILSTFSLFFGVSILFFTFKHKLERTMPDDSSSLEAYLAKEQAGNFSVKKEFPLHLLLTIHLDKIPKINTSSLLGFYQKLENLSAKPMFQGEHYSNLELKTTFGMNHFQTLITYEETYRTFLQCLIEYGIKLYEEEYYHESIQALCYVLELDSTLYKCYLYLCKNYVILEACEDLDDFKNCFSRFKNYDEEKLLRAFAEIQKTKS